MKFNLRSQQINYFKRDLLLKLVCACWIITKLLCYKLWLADRFFPLAPVYDGLLYVSSYVHTSLFWLSIVCMAAFWIFPGKKIAVILFLSEIISCMLDQNRWQPWEYQFICMLGAYIFIPVAGPGGQDEKMRRQCWQIIIVGIYFFSGINKFNSYFIHNVWGNIFLKHAVGIYNPGPWLLRMGYALPMIEACGAIALCFGRTRKMAVLCLVLMNLLMLIVGFSGNEIGMIIMPWNILMAFLLFGLFFKAELQSFRPALKPIYSPVMLLAWWILPWLQFAGLWDKYLSGVLYSGDIENLYICTDDLYASSRLSGDFVQGNKNMSCNVVLSVYQWGMKEMNAAPYPAVRVYKAIAENWKHSFPKATNKFFLFRTGFMNSVRSLPGE